MSMTTDKYLDQFEYCPNCDKEKKDVAYEMPDGDYVCLDCYTSLGDRAEAEWESERDLA